MGKSVNQFNSYVFITETLKNEISKYLFNFTKKTCHFKFLICVFFSYPKRSSSTKINVLYPYHGREYRDI